MISINNVIINIEKYPNGELYFKKENIKTIFYKDDDENMKNKKVFTLDHFSHEQLIALIFLVNHFKKVCPKDKFLLYLPYLPYSRMDRIQKNVVDVFSLKYFCDIINSLKFDNILVDDCHSDVGIALLNNATNSQIFMSSFIKAMTKKYNNKLYFVYPDTSAEKRYAKFINDTEIDVVRVFKKREWDTGKITSIDVFHKIEKINKEYPTFIVDDLCSYGGTFDLVSIELQKQGFQNIQLAVTHCEDSIFKGKLLDENHSIQKIYTTDSIITMFHQKIQIARCVLTNVD